MRTRIWKRLQTPTGVITRIEGGNMSKLVISTHLQLASFKLAIKIYPEEEHKSFNDSFESELLNHL